jgi:hypothetical protein
MRICVRGQKARFQCSDLLYFSVPALVEPYQSLNRALRALIEP